MIPRIAMTAACEEQFDWALEMACDDKGSRAIDVRLADDHVTRAHEMARYVRERVSEQVELRYHFPVGTFDFSARDELAGTRGFLGVVEAIDGVAADRGRYVTVHLALGFDDAARRLPLARHRLAELVAYAAESGVTLCLENLRWGVTSDPDIFMGLVETTGCGVTFDVGHANSSDVARRGFGSVEFAQVAAGHIRNAHIYEREDPHHIMPMNLDCIGPTLEVLLATECDWWVIELFDRDEVDFTRRLLREFLETRQPSNRGVA